MARFVIACLVGICAGAAAAQAPDTNVDESIRNGVAAFERGDLDAARSIFGSVLEREPDNVTAIYELAYTLVTQGEPEEALRVVDEALGRDLEPVPEFFTLSASVLDNLGRQNEAIDRFEQGIAAFPNDHGLHLNLGVTQVRSGDMAAARATFERAAALQPEHPSAHFYLGHLYADEGRVAAAILALGKSLAFDNQGQRMATSAGTIQALMDTTVRTLDDGRTLIVVPPESILPTESLDQFSDNLPMYVGMAVTMQRKTDGDMTYEPYALAYSFILTAFVEAEIDPASSFVVDHYLGFFAPIVENGHQMTFSHLILAGLNPELASEWVSTNTEAVQAFRTWARDRVTN